MKFMKLDHLQGGGKPQSCQEFKLQKTRMLSCLPKVIEWNNFLECYIYEKNVVTSNGIWVIKRK